MENHIEELSVEDYKKAEKYVYQQNEKLLKDIGVKYGKQVLEEIEYELFADAGSVGIHEIVESPKGVYADGNGTKDNYFKGAWFDDKPGRCGHTKDAYDYSCYMKIKEGAYFKYNSIK